jgi:2-oxoisovalerate dehydrogenase E2 component (dihydrolipoyl transacylase)
MLEVKLSDIGEGMAEATINCYFVKPGDVVKADQPLLEVQTDKMTAEIPAPTDGVIKDILVLPGENIPVGTTLLVIDRDSSANTSRPVERTKSTKAQVNRIMASPYTRKIARENGLLIDEINGTGPGGRITDDDVYRMIEKRTIHAKLDQSNSTTEIQPAPILAIDNKKEIPLQSEMIPFRGKRRQIAKKMIHSLHTIAHCTHFEEIDVSALLAFRDELKKQDRQITLTAFFLKALSQCLKEFPIFNATLLEDEEAICLQKEHHIGVAVDTEDGLIVPVIRNIEQKSILAIHTEVKNLTQKALQNQLSLKDISGGTFTISNVGPLGGSTGATPIIQHPEVALVSFHKTKKRPVVTDDDQIVVRSIMNISMSFDHRVADGATAVAFTNRLTELIEKPNLLLLELV